MSIITFLLEFTVIRVSVFVYAVQKPATEIILVKGLQISEHMLLRHHVLHDVITTMHVTRVVNHIPMVMNTIYS